MRGYNDGVKTIIQRLRKAVDAIAEDNSEYDRDEIQGAMEDAIGTIDIMYSDMENVLDEWK